MPRRAGGRSARVAAIGLGGAALTAGFVLWGLPYERVAAPLAGALGRATSLELEIEALAPRLSWLGPGLEARGVRAAAPGGVALRIEALRLRPAWSLGWLRLRPVLWLDADLAGGRAAGELALAPAGFAGGVRGADLAALPLAALWPGAALSGRLDATLDLRAQPYGAAGRVSLAARDGLATLPTLPLPLPFATLTAELEPGEDPRLRLVALELVGAGLRVRGSGTLGAAARLARAPLDLAFDLEVEPDLRPVLAQSGLRLRPDGRATLRLGGTLDRPVLR
jgi:type II secretion system protein N